MEADYGDVVPRRDFERLEAQFNVSAPFTVFKTNWYDAFSFHKTVIFCE